MKTQIGRKFVDRFGEIEAQRIWEAALSHRNGVHDKPGSDEFKWALLIAIGYQCMEIDRYRDHHGIETPWDDLKQWIKNEADLGTHDGDCDYITLVGGGYNEFVDAANGGSQSRTYSTCSRGRRAGVRRSVNAGMTW